MVLQNSFVSLASLLSLALGVAVGCSDGQLKGSKADHPKQLETLGKSEASPEGSVSENQDLTQAQDANALTEETEVPNGEENTGEIVVDVDNGLELPELPVCAAITGHLMHGETYEISSFKDGCEESELRSAGFVSIEQGLEALFAEIPADSICTQVMGSMQYDHGEILLSAGFSNGCEAAKLASIGFE